MWPPFPKIPKVTKPGVHIPTDLFACIIGYDDLKQAIITSLKGNSPFFRHFLFVGPPATAKSLFFMELERLGAFWITGESKPTKVGLREVLSELKPLVLCIDELDKLRASNRNILLSPLDEYGRLTVVKSKEQRAVKIETRIFAAANQDNFSPELRDRFWIINLKPYTEEEFIDITREVIRYKIKIDLKTAEEIGREVWRISKSIRDGLRIAGAIKTGMNKEQAISLLHHYHPEASSQ